MEPSTAYQCWKVLKLAAIIVVVTLLGSLWVQLDWYSAASCWVTAPHLPQPAFEEVTRKGNGAGQGPMTAVVARVWQKYPSQKWRGLQLPVLSAMPAGRLGNVMGEYATLYALGRTYNVTVLLSPDMASSLAPIFPNLSMAPIPGQFVTQQWVEVGRTSKMNYARSEVAAAGLLGPYCFLLNSYLFEMQLFHHYRAEVVRELTFSAHIINQAEEFLRWVVTGRGPWPVSPILVGVHVRRTDYHWSVRRYGGVLPERPYFRRALQHYRDRFPQVVFVASSDDRSYLQQVFGNFSDVVLSPGGVAELDLAVLSRCNHSIITLGSFSFWAGYLAGGQVVYPLVNFTKPYPFGMQGYSLAGLHNFHPLPIT